MDRLAFAEFAPTPWTGRPIHLVQPRALIRDADSRHIHLLAPGNHNRPSIIADRPASVMAIHVTWIAVPPAIMRSTCVSRARRR
jgi:hypothetical protein